MLTIGHAACEEWTAALERALAHVPAGDRSARVEQCRHLLASGVLEPQGVFVARSEGAIAAAQICVPLAGAACLFWLPAADNPGADASVHAAVAWCRGWQCKIAQALAADTELERIGPLVRNGFRLITRLCHLERDFDHLPAVDPSIVRLESYQAANAAQFAATLEKTYEGTLDCPELNGRRTTEEILAGHRGQGRFDPRFWWLAYAGAQPAGVLILVEMADALSWELAYVGVVPQFRRHGVGRALALHALHAIADQATRVTLIVDERNGPARHLYESLRFRQVDASNVLLFFP